MTAPAPRTLEITDSGARLDIALNRPDERNALTFEAWDDLDRVMAGVERRDDLRVVTLTGNGPAFCAGVDFAAIGASLEVEKGSYPSFIRRWAAIVDRFERVPQPSVAAINGPVIGAGLELALACDIRIASDRAVFAMPQMRMGIVPDVGGTSRLARATGESFAKDMILTSRIVDAEEALRAGIVSRVVEHDRLEEELDGVAAAVESLPWPSAYFASLAIDCGPRLDPRRAADIEALADQVMLRQEEVWRNISDFMAAKGLRGLGR
ncbi:enoyl-CoA hydratase/isomerase family protein [Thermobifida halotolerans]|uniref:Enoyl-CoA hydratase/isomerase family protein n=1 Tax=Thermobifida halotolerans TaxID=483545 RepID=A0AA97LZX2_9ACTN|nr:enoyl-CoA hydratase/isomerase family protein [Thermobifida halotolerans]UOE21229.1 enoyl-CoA hydratase/isomerase family protein [Thermobifida halotolerans]